MPIDWQMVAAIAVGSTAIGALARHLYGWATRDSSVASMAQTAQATAALAVAKIELLQREVTAEQIKNAGLFSEIKAMASSAMQGQLAAEGRMTRAIEDVGREVKGMSDRIDRVLETSRFVPKSA
jgi:hypothetical protein